MGMDSIKTYCIFALFDTEDYQHAFVTQKCIT